MSLLNDALRGAEQQRKNERPAAAYVGQGASAGSQARERSPLAWVITVALVAALAIAVVIYWLYSSAPDSVTNAVPVSTEPQSGTPEDVVASPELKRVQRPDPESVESTENDPAAQPDTEASAGLADPAPDSRNGDRNNPLSASAAAMAETTSDDKRLEQDLKPQEAVASTPVVADEPAQADAAPDEQAARDSAGEPVAEPPSQSATAQVAPTASQNQTPEEIPSPEPKPEQAVKQQKQTPELVDRRTDTEIRTLLSRGQVSTAAQTLAELLREQPAPRSRARFARYLIVQGQPRQALDWLPPDATRAHASLRLLRARALLADGQAGEALTTLESEVPSVRESAEYTVTLATLLQQQGRSNAAVTRWAELIEYDSSKGPWWVGLAIALEADRQPAGALRACQQAIRLPGLARSLENYCRQRVAALRAG
ncbi:MAG: hypothetical protein KGY54_14690 [Oleiphilaceae bacterium]|nr:hypothetical protein [Oleiphilaceae bacterium]